MTKCCEIGTYKCQDIAFICETCGHVVWVDKCLCSEVASLHAAGINTLGCCCGHGAKQGYIQVIPEHVDEMLRLGYEQEPETPEGFGKWCFIPKSACPESSGATDKVPAIHDKAANEIRFTCECGHVTHIVRPDPFELLSLYQDGMSAMCGECKKMNELELTEVVK